MSSRAARPTPGSPSGVPGTVAGLEWARDRYGTKPRAALMAPAIALARDGFVLAPADTSLLQLGTPDFARDPGDRRDLHP